MSLGTRGFNILICLFFLVGLTNCGGEKTKSDLAEVEVIPEKPIVITAPTENERGQKVEPPWFEFRMRMMNGSDQSITIVAITLEVFGQGPTGVMESKEVAFVPSDFNFSLSEDTECKYTSFGTWGPTEPKALLLRNAIAACDRTPRFVVGGNPKGVNGRFFRYRVRAKPLGWFGTEDLAEDRFQKVLTFFTQ